MHTYVLEYTGPGPRCSSRYAQAITKKPLRLSQGRTTGRRLACPKVGQRSLSVPVTQSAFEKIRLWSPSLQNGQQLHQEYLESFCQYLSQMPAAEA